jgi:hypothetical protein
VTLLTRVALVLAAVVALAGVGATAQADTVATNTPNNLCVVVPPAKVAVCVGRL